MSNASICCFVKNFGKPLFQFRQRQIFYRRTFRRAVPDEKFVKRPQRGKPKLRRRAAQIISSEKSHEAAKIIALKFFPNRRRFSFLKMPAEKFRQRLFVIPLRINRRAAIHGQVREKFFNPLVRQFRLAGWSIGHIELIQQSAGICSKMRALTDDFVSVQKAIILYGEVGASGPMRSLPRAMSSIHTTKPVPAG